jgi:hypothetical protein
LQPVPECAVIVRPANQQTAIRAGTKLIRAHWIDDRPIPIPQAPRLVGSSGVANCLATPSHFVQFALRTAGTSKAAPLARNNLVLIAEHRIREQASIIRVERRKAQGEIIHGTLYVVVAAGCPDPDLVADLAFRGSALTPPV